MAVATVTANNNNIAVGTAATDAGTWGNDGGGGGVADEPDLVYQGTTAQSRKVSTTLIGRSYTDTAGVDATATDRRHFIFKLWCSNYAALNTRTTPGSELKVGSSSGNYHSYYLFGSDNYPVAGGWQFVALSPNVSGYASAVGDTGTPNDASVLYYSWLGDYTATSKSENHAIDSIDQGAGLWLVGGDGADPDAVFDDFLTFDEGTSGNRFGYVRSQLGIYFVNGELAIGENTGGSVATVFQDTTGQVLVWGNGLVETGFHRFKLDLGGTGTDIDITGATFDSIGKVDNDGERGYTTTEDSRLVVEATGTTGTANLVGCVIKNTASVTLTSAVTLDACDVETADLTQAGAEIFDSVIRTTSLTNTAAIDDATFGASTDLRDTQFIQAGAGHAIEISGASPTVTLTGILFDGYGADATSSSAIWVTATGTTTINISGGGDTPTIRNTGGGTVNVVNAITVSITALDAATTSAVSGAFVSLEAAAGGPRAALASVTSITRSGSTATVTMAAPHGLSSGQDVVIRGAAEDEYNGGGYAITVTSTTVFTYTVTGTPATPATGTITATSQLLNGTTNGSGVIEDTGYPYISDQPVTGRVRKGTASPFYKSSGIVGTITSTGFSANIAMVADE